MVYAMTDKERTKKSKILAYLLRHDSSYNYDEHGWRSVRELLENHNFTLTELVEIVETDDKDRYEFDDKLKNIRARQGHSVSVDVELTKTEPPEFLYHGTATRFLDSIMRSGIKKMTRQYVHLSPDIETATKVGIRHGEVVVLVVNAQKMSRDGQEFFLSRNGVWLTDYVDPKYIREL